MDRREFLRRAAAAGAAGAALFLERGVGGLWAQGAPSAPGATAGKGTSGGARASAAPRPDLVAVKGGDPAPMLDRALRELGGMGAFVRKGQTVAIKPNIGWDQGPEAAANTNPALVGRLVELCLAAGARKVWVFDHSCDSGPRCYASSRIERYAKEAGALVVPADSSSRYQEVAVPGAARLKRFKVHELVLEADVLINVPVLKQHSGAGMTCAMKNLMGIAWDRGEFHSLGLDRCIADVCLYRKPDLTVVDAWKVMLSGGPRGNAATRYDDQKMLMAGTDPVALDSAAARIMGGASGDYEYIAFAEALGLGRSDLAKLDIRRLTM